MILKDEKNKTKLVQILDDKCVIFFEKIDYKGKFFKLCEDTPDITAEDLPISYDKFSSIILTKNTEVAFFDQIKYENQNDKDEGISTKVSISDLSKTKIKPRSVKFTDASSFTISSEVYNSGKSIPNFIVGTLEGFFSEIITKNETISRRKKFDSCISAKYDNDVKEQKVQPIDLDDVERYSDSNISFLEKLMENKSTILSSILSYYCNFKTWLINGISQITSALELLVDKSDKQKKIDKSINPSKEEQRERDRDINNAKFILSTISGGKIKNYDKGGVLEDFDFTSIPTFLVNSDEFEEGRFDNKVKRFKRGKDQNSMYKITKKNKKAKKYRNGGKYNNSLNPVRRKFRIQITNKRSRLVDAILEGSRIVWEKLKEFFNNYVVKPFKAVASFFKRIFESIIKFFKMILEINFTQIIKCSILGGSKILNLYNSLYYKFLLLKFTLPIPVVGPFFLVDFVLSQLCMYDYYRIAIKYFKKGIAWSKSHPNELNEVKWTYFGNGFGNILISIAKSASLINPFLSEKNKIKETYDGLNDGTMSLGIL